MGRWTAIVLATAVLAGCGGGGDGAPGTDLPLAYLHLYGGVVGGVAEARIERDGAATVDGGRAPGCERGTRRFRMTADELDRVRRLVEPMRDVRPRKRETPAGEAPTVRLTFDDFELLYTGFEPLPEDVKALVDELERLVNDHCARGGP
jgi:hypothetical protein